MPEINGEHGKILAEIHAIALQIAVMKERQELNHQENKTDIGISFEKLEVVERRVNLLPCSAHVEKFSQYDNTRKVLVGTIFGCVVAIVSFAVAWGSMQTRVGEHLRNSEQILEKCCDV